MEMSLQAANLLRAEAFCFLMLGDGLAKKSMQELCEKLP